MRLYIAVLDDVPDYIVPTLVAHGMLSAHLKFVDNPVYQDWIQNSFKKCVVRVNRKEFDRIAALPDVFLGYESTTLGGEKCSAIALPCATDQLPNVLKFAKLWKPLVTT